MRKSNKRLKKLLFYFISFCLALLALTIVYFFFTSKALYINNITTAPTEYSSSVTSIVNTILGDKRLYLIPASHTAFIPKGNITHAIQSTLPEVNQVTIKHTSLSSLSITINLRKPLFRLENGLAVDLDGIVYKEPKNIDSLPLLETRTNLPSKDRLAQVSTFESKLSSSMFGIDLVEVDENSDVKYYIKDHVNKAYVITRLDDDINVVWSTLVSAKDTDPLKSKLESSINTLQYVDLRFGNKVFYKFGKSGSIGTTIPVIGTTTTTYDTRILAEPNR